MSWYDTSYRKLFFDFHSAGTTVGLAAGFDAERWAERLQAAQAQAVSIIVKCGRGYSYYRQGAVRYVHPQLPPGMDMLGEQLAALHRRGMHGIGYYHTFSSEPVARDHPDWPARDAQGVRNGDSICMLGPVLEEWMLPHLEEVVSLYDLDALFFDGTYARQVPCFCDACRARFSRACGGLSIPENAGDPAWPRYVAWALQAMREVRATICDTVHKYRPEMPISFNYAYYAWQPEEVPDEVGTLMADIFPDDQTFNGSFLARYWAMSGKPFDVMNSAFLQWWGDWGCKPAVAMQQEVATAIANGGLTWIGYQMNAQYDVEPAVMAELGKTLAFVREREPLLLGARPIPHVAVLHSTHANLAGDEVAVRSSDYASLRGAHRALTESMIPYHVFHEEGLLQRLPELRAVIIPDQRYLEPRVVEALDAWVRAGGVLLATGLSGTKDEAYRDAGRMALQELLGVRYEGTYDQPHAYIRVTDERLTPGTLDMPHLAEARFALVQPVADDVQVLARLHKVYLRSDGQFLLRWSPVGEDSGHPAITLRAVGKGWAAYIAGDAFRAYQVKNQWNLKHIVANLLNVLIADPIVRVTAPAWVEVALMRQPTADGKERILVHLVNPHGNRPVDGNNVCVEQVLPVRGILVRLRAARRPQRVTLEPGGAEPWWGYADGTVVVQVPEVDIHTAIVIA